MKERFSDRIGVTKPVTQLTLNEITKSQRNRLWNISHHFLWEKSGQYWIDVSPTICDEFFRLPKQSVDHRDYHWLYQKFFDSEFKWFDVYNFIEYIGDNFGRLNLNYSINSYYEKINKILEEEFSGYRYIANELAQITNEVEIKSITDSMEQAKKNRLFGAATHFESALEFLSLKPEPEFRNTIKESISAVESIVKQVTNEKGGGLDKALAILDSKIKFHGGFKAGVLSLYGYTSDEDGIRHPILKEKVIGFDEAKYMLVSCSALVNFLIAKAEKSGLLKTDN